MCILSCIYPGNRWRQSDSNPNPNPKFGLTSNFPFLNSPNLQGPQKPRSNQNEHCNLAFYGLFLVDFANRQILTTLHHINYAGQS